MGPVTITGAASQSLAPTPPSPSLPPPTIDPCRVSSCINAKTKFKFMTPTKHKKARVEAVKEITTVEDAITKLVSRKYSVPDQEYTFAHLATILLQLTATLPAEGASIVKAVAILVNELDINDHAERMVTSFMCTLQDPLEGFIQVGTTPQSHTDHIIDSHESIKNCMLEMVSRIDNLHSAFCEAQEHAKTNTSAVQNMIATLEKCTFTPGAQNSPPNNPAPDTYTSRAHAQIPTVHNKVMAHTEERQRQIFFTKAQGMASQGLDNQNAQLIITKANLALAAMKTTHNNTPEGIMSAKPSPRVTFYLTWTHLNLQSGSGKKAYT
jgi:hypothetical protein